ncbi:dihydrolipoamide acetyltransferase family protein [Desulfoferrobacter suflitae]|uniref:dihydrolipoamide acetyltransferase family protein n=1 Tax=Desulfoferrobacter suflitae TaxID=2865782 RepID=UPI002164E6D5|nr:dihydrolipoamide acetyltransferase family protein [Desulfoferrobacter suflitae]MCK8601642.1 2-oxo acid dehydrogenase subunit E2 [Desulfoferrobacter suflitae]
MPREFKLPDLGEGIHEGEVVEVLVSVGDAVEDGSPVMIIETDKAETEIPSPVNGVVKQINVKAGDIVKVGDVLMVFTEAGEADAKGEARPAGEETKQEGAVEEKAAQPEKEVEEEEGQREETAEQPGAKGSKPGPVPAAPSTRRLARELGVDLHSVTASGPGGRVTAEDVRAFAARGQRPREAPAETPSTQREPAAPPSPTESGPLPDFTQWGPVERQPLRSVRRATAKRMAQSWSQIPHVTHADEADITGLEAFRRKHKQEVAARGGSLSLTVFALKAAVAALKMFPRFNASLDSEKEEIILKNYYHIGVAVDTDKGLIVPSIRDVDRKSIFQLARELDELLARAREGKVDREDMVGGTFTITNVGPLGGTGFTPIINYPQVAILGLAKARYRPVVMGEEGAFKIVPRLILPLIVGFDHRVLDGADAARFINTIISALHDPEQLLMTM